MTRISTDGAKVWVVEIKFIGSLGREVPSWQPCAEASISRSDARSKMLVWQKRNPDDKFRVRQYRRIGK